MQFDTQRAGGKMKLIKPQKNFKTQVNRNLPL